MGTRRVGFLGPEGSFSHEAVVAIGIERPVAYDSIEELLGAVDDGAIDEALAPLENALEGTVSATIDALVFDHDLLIRQEVVLPIHLRLLARPGVKLEEVTRVRSYPHALGQARRFLHEHHLVGEPAASTSQAAREVAESPEPLAALASPLAGQLFGLEVIASAIDDESTNATRFVLVGRDVVVAPTGHDRTTIVCYQDDDRPGSLWAILGHFAARAINLTKLESRPTKRGLGDYCFVIEFEGHVDDDVIADCLVELQAHHARVKFLGSYPITGEAAGARRDAVSSARREATTWLESIRQRVRRESGDG